MSNLGFEPREISKQTNTVPLKTRNRLRIPPLPKHMHPVYNEGRRKDRAANLNRKLQGKHDVVYTDAAEYPTTNGYVAVVARGDGTMILCCSTRGGDATEAEEIAIALALKQNNIRIIVSDSKQAIRNYNEVEYLRQQCASWLKGTPGGISIANMDTSSSGYARERTRTRVCPRSHFPGPYNTYGDSLLRRGPSTI